MAAANDSFDTCFLDVLLASTLQLALGRTRLIPTHPTVESVTTEFKRQSYSLERDPRNDWKSELAKDVAALANRDGGDIYIGIEETADRPPRFSRYFEPRLDTAWQRDYEAALRLSLTPLPVVRYEESISELGTTIGIVRVERSPQPVLLMTLPGEAKSAVYLPVRTRWDTVYAQPREIIMAIRSGNLLAIRKLQELKEAPAANQATFTVVLGGNVILNNYVLDVMTEDEVVFWENRPGGTRATIPKLYIETVWRRCADIPNESKFVVAVSPGKLAGTGDGNSLFYIPGGGG